jgi:ABC-2 type transport system permease protein
MMRAFWKLFVSNVKEFVRDKMALFWMLAFPVFIILLFGAVFGREEDTSFDIGLVVEDSGPAATGVAKAFEQVPVFNVHRGELSEELEALKKGDRRAVVVLPEGLSDAIASKEPLDIPVYYDPASQTASQIVLSIIRRVLEEVDRRISGAPRILRLSEQTILGRRMRYIDYLLPGVIAMALMQLGVFGTAHPIISLRERQVLRRLGVTPLPRSTFLAADVLLRLLIALIQVALLLAIGMLLFKVQVIGSWSLFAGFIALGAATFIALGFVVASVSPTEEAGVAISQLLNLPMMFLSGIFFPMEMIPEWMMPVVKAMPLTYLGDALRQVMVGASALHPLHLDAAVLGGWLIICIAISVRFFRWE